MALEVGSVVARLSAKLDDSAFDRFDKRIRDVRQDTRRPVEAELRGDHDDSGFDRFDRRLRDVRQDTRRKVEADLRADVDATGFQRFESRLRNVRQDARRDVEVDLKADVDSRGFDRFDKELDRADKSRGKFGAGLKTLGPVAAAASAAAGAGAALLGKRFVDSASAIAESTSKIRTVLGAEGAALEEFSKTSATSIGQSREAALEATGTFAALFKNLGQSSSQAAKSSVDFTKLASDLASFNNTSPEEAVEALGAGLRGEAEPLRRYGVLLDDATLRQAALKEGLVKSTKEALDPQTKALAAQAVIFQQTKTQQGDFQRTSGGLANQQRILKARLTDVGSELGQRLLPVALKVVGGINNLVGAAQRGRGPLVAIGRAVKSVANAAGEAARFVSGFARDIGRAFTGPSRDAGRLGKSFGRTFDTISDTVRTLGRNLGRIFDGIGGDLRSIARSAATFGRAFASHILPIIRRVLPGLRDAIEGIAGIVRNVVKLIAAILRGDFSDAFEAMGGIVKGAFKLVRGVMRAAVGGILGAAKSIGRAILDGVVDLVESIPGKIGRFLGAARNRLRELPGSFANAAKGIGRAVVNGVIDGVSGLGGAIADAGRSIGRKLLNAVKGFLGISSPSRAFLDVGKNVIQGLAGGINAGNVADIARKAFGGLPSLAAKLIKGGAINLAGLPVKGLKALASKLGDVGGSLRDKIRDKIRDKLGLDDDKKDRGSARSRRKAAAATRRGFFAGGKVGPTSGGARAFIAGEGDRDEWVISQEGDRASNVGYARDALQALTGRPVPMHRAGRGRKSRRAPAATLTREANAGITRSNQRADAGVALYETGIQNLEREYDLANRRADADPNEYLVEQDDGSVAIDAAAQRDRASELQGLEAKRRQIRDKIAEYRRKVAEAIAAYSAGIRTLNQALAAARGKRRGKEREGYREKIAEYTSRRDELTGVHGDLDFDRQDADIDLGELSAELAVVRGARGKAAAPPDPPEPPDLNTLEGNLSVGEATEASAITRDSALADLTPGTEDDDAVRKRGENLYRGILDRLQRTGGASEAVTGAAQALKGFLPQDSAGGAGGSPADAASAALAQVGAFNASRADLFGGQGSNFLTPNTPFGSLGVAAGTRFFGGASGGTQAGTVAGSGGVTQHITFTGPQPADPHQFTAASLHEMKAAL